MIEQEAKMLIEKATAYGVSDIHLLPLKDKYGVYYRINGRLVPQVTRDFEWGKRIISHFKFLADMDVGERRRPQSGATNFDLSNEIVELRFSTITNVKMLESLVIRVIKQEFRESQPIHTFFPNDIQKLRYLVRRKSGLVLFSGPVGSGKTTTIYQLLRERIQEETLQVITMEDPVEIYDPRFLQTQINEKAGISYDLLIKSSLRHHPDVLMIGEVRDEETARMMIRGALTGHLMIATIHAKDTFGVIGRLQELKITQEQLQQTLIGVVSQRLISRYCSLCQGGCNIYCNRLAPNLKRAALFELLADDDLKIFLSQKEVPKGFISLNDKLNKAWRCGYIETKDYHRFKII